MTRKRMFGQQQLKLQQQRQQVQLAASSQQVCRVEYRKCTQSHVVRQFMPHVGA